MGQIKLAAIEPKWLLQLNELQTQSTDESFTERGAQHNKRSQKDTDEDDEYIVYYRSKCRYISLVAVLR